MTKAEDEAIKEITRLFLNGNLTKEEADKRLSELVTDRKTSK